MKISSEHRQIALLTMTVLLIYGLGGLIVPFVGIKLIGVIVNLIHLV